MNLEKLEAASGIWPVSPKGRSREARYQQNGIWAEVILPVAFLMNPKPILHAKSPQYSGAVSRLTVKHSHLWSKCRQSRISGSLSATTTNNNDTLERIITFGEYMCAFRTLLRLQEAPMCSELCVAQGHPHCLFCPINLDSHSRQACPCHMYDPRMAAAYHAREVKDAIHEIPLEKCGGGGNIMLD